MIVELPGAGGTRHPVELMQPQAPALAPEETPRFNRLAYAAAHVVAAAPGPDDPRSPDAIDWEATLRFRHHLWSLGFGVAEAMDAAQRDVLGWENSAHLLERTLAAAREQPGRLVIGGAGTDHLTAAAPRLSAIIDAYVSQAEFIHERGGRAILFPTAHLPRRFPEPRQTVQVYREVSAQVSKPVWVHWLGEMFAPALKGYFPGDSFERVMDDNPNLLGVKLSLLDPEREAAIRRRLAGQGQVVLTGDDFHYPALIRGTQKPAAGGERRFAYEGRSFEVGDYSHALLGILGGIAPVAARALACLAEGAGEDYAGLLEPTQPLARHIFGVPTQHYKAGLVLLAYLNGHQPRFHLLDTVEARRDPLHYVELFRLANAAGILEDPQAAYVRFQPLLARWGL